MWAEGPLVSWSLFTNKKDGIKHTSLKNSQNYRACFKIISVRLKVILHNLASCLAFYKDYVKACTYFKKLLDLEPENTEVMGSYGRVLAMAGEVEDSKKILENALHLAEERHEEQLIEQVCIKKIQRVKRYLCAHVFYIIYSTTDASNASNVITMIWASFVKQIVAKYWLLELRRFEIRCLVAITSLQSVLEPKGAHFFGYVAYCLYNSSYRPPSVLTSCLDGFSLRWTWVERGREICFGTTVMARPQHTMNC